jgi:hypothetical protein
MRLTSTGLGIGLGGGSPGEKLEVNGRIAAKSSADLNLAFVLNNTASGGREWQLIGSATGGMDGGGTFNVRDNTAGANRVTLDSSGNLGLGVTPSAWASLKVLEVGTSKGNYIGGLSTTLYQGSNSYFDGSWRYANTGSGASRYEMYGGHTWLTAPSGTAGNTISFTQAMTLTAAGDLLVGTSSPSFSGNMELRKNQNTANFDIYASGDATANNVSKVRLYNNANQAAIGCAGANLVFYVSDVNTERARITAAGDLLVGKTTVNDSSENGFLVYGSSAGNQGAVTSTVNDGSAAVNSYHLYNKNATNNGYRFYVSTNGGIYNFSANNSNLSDERVKTAITPAPSYLDKLDAIKVVNFKYKDQLHDEFNVGVIAQQVLSVAPEFVNEDGFGETPDDGIPLMSIYETDLKYAMLKAIQELSAKVTALEAKVN